MLPENILYTSSVFFFSPLAMTVFLKSIIRLSPLLIGCYFLAKAYAHKMRYPISNSQRRLRMIAGAFYKPKYSENSSQGEDAHFICNDEQTIGVADGVGAWSEYGIDAGGYARELVENASIAIKNKPNGAVNPKEVLIEAHSKTKSEGSSTACIVTLVGRCLHAVNVGDSGFMVIRDGNIIYQSPVKHHGFNYPFQLSRETNSDQPSAEEDLEVSVESGDVVVVATDGLFDNMHSHEIAHIVRQGKEQGLTPKQLAWILAEFALYISMDEGRNTPFSEAASKAEYFCPGGKVDDITVVVAYII